MFSGGIQSLLKEGSRHFSGTEEAILRNIEACKQLATVTRTSLGPLGMNKIIINHLDKIFVTSDASTIAREMDVNHPAAKLIVMAA
jgi:T-complex protein 1 subunit theta